MILKSVLHSTEKNFTTTFEQFKIQILIVHEMKMKVFHLNV